MNSFNHYAYGAIGDWMYRVMAGIEIDPAAPGYKHILIQPQPGGGFTSASASHVTPLRARELRLEDRRPHVRTGCRDSTQHDRDRATARRPAHGGHRKRPGAGRGRRDHVVAAGWRLRRGRGGFRAVPVRIHPGEIAHQLVPSSRFFHTLAPRVSTVPSSIQIEGTGWPGPATGGAEGCGHDTQTDHDVDARLGRSHSDRGRWRRTRASSQVKPKVTTVEVTRRDLVQEISATGSLEAVTTVNVGSQMSGIVQTLYADFNDIVRKGQTLARLDPSLFQTQVEQAEANLIRAEADVERLEVARDAAKLTLERTRHAGREAPRVGRGSRIGPGGPGLRRGAGAVRAGIGRAIEGEPEPGQGESRAHRHHLAD